MQRNFSRKGMLRGGSKIGQDNGDGDEAGESISPLGKSNLTSESTCSALASFHQNHTLTIGYALPLCYF